MVWKRIKGVKGFSAKSNQELKITSSDRQEKHNTHGLPG
jgi:hypothetical protein